MPSSAPAQTVLVAGGGIGGIQAATRLRRRLDRRHRVVLVNRDPDFSLTASYLWVMTGARRPDQITRPLSRLERQGIDVVIGEISHLDPEARALTVQDRTLVGDHMVVSLGADWAADRVPGLVEFGHTFATVAGVQLLAGELKRMESGRIVVVTAAPVYKCPAAPYEAALLIDAELRSRGIRDRFEIAIRSAEPAPMPAGGPEVSTSLGQILAERGIDYEACQVTGTEEGRIYFGDASEEADLIVYMPPITPPPIVADSALAGPDGWVEAHPTSLAAAFEGVYAIGDITEITLANGRSLPRTGNFAHSQAHVAADMIAATITGKPAPAGFDGFGGCYVETGVGRAAYGSGNFYATPAPDVVMHPPSRRWHWSKVVFERQVMQTWL